MMPLSALTTALRSTCLELIPLVCLWKHLYKLYTSFLNDGKDSPMNTSRHEFVCMNVLFIYLNYFIFFPKLIKKIGENKITFSVRLKNWTFLKKFFCFKLLNLVTIMFFRYAVRNFITYIDGNFFNLYRSNNVYFLFIFCLYQFHRICLLHCSVLKINFQILPGTCLSIITPINQYSSTKWSPTWNTMKVRVRVMVRKSHFQTYSYTSAYHSTYPLCLYHMMGFFSKTHFPCFPAYQSLYPP